jgi:hypothetical protein
MDQEADGKRYYVARTVELLAEFDQDAGRWRPILAQQYGREAAEAVLRAGRAEFEALIPHIPYIGGEDGYTGSLVESVRCLALYRAMQRQGRSAEETGRVLYDAVLARLSEPQAPPAQPLTAEQLMDRRRRRAERSQERCYPAGYVNHFVAGDGQTFDYGYDFTECAAFKFYRAQGAEGFLPFFCSLDYAYSQVYGLGLVRTTTLAEGGARCDHRFKAGRQTEVGWPPPFVAAARIGAA